MCVSVCGCSFFHLALALLFLLSSSLCDRNISSLISFFSLSPKELFQLTCSVFSQFVDDAPATATEKDKAALLSEPSPVVVQDVVPAPEPSTSRSVKEVSFDIPASPRQEPTPGPPDLGDDEPLLTPTKQSKKSKRAKKTSVSAPDSWVPVEPSAADPSTTPRGGDAIGDASPTVLAVQEASEQQAAVEPPAPATDVVPPDQAALDSASGGEPTGGHHTEAGPAVGPQHPEDPDAVDDEPSTSRDVAADAEAPKEAKKGLFASSSALPSFRLGSFFSLKKKPQLESERAESSEATTLVEESSGRDDATPIPVPPSLVVSGQLDEPRALSPGPAEPGPNVEPLQGSQELVARDKSVDDTTGAALDTAVSQPDERVEGPVGSTPDLTLTDTIASVLEVGSGRDLHADDSLHQQQQPSRLEQEIDAAPVVVAASDQIIEGDSTPTANESSAAMDRDQDVGATKKKGKKSKAKQRQTTEDEPIDAPLVEAVVAVEPEPVVVEEPVVAEGDVMVESGAKKGKKGKKKKQSAAVPDEPESPAEALVVEEQLAAPDVSEPVISEASPEVSSVVDAVAVEASEPTSALETPLVAEAQEGESAVPASQKSKKKKKKQGSAVSDDSEPPLATTSEAQEELVAEDAAAPVVAEELQVVEAAPVEAPESSVPELPEADEAAPVSKKGKKNKKKKQGSVALDGPASPAVDSGDVGDEAVVSETSREVAVPSELEVAPVESAEAAVVEGSELVSEPLAVEVSEPVSEPAAVEVPEDESAVPSSKKSKKDNKKKKQQDAAEASEPPVIESTPEPPAVETLGAADLEPATPVEVAVPEQPVGEEVALEQPVEEEVVREEAVQDDRLPQPVAGKKGKKDKKKKTQAALDESSDPAPVEEPVQETALEPEVRASFGTRSNETTLTDEQAIVEKEVSPLEESAPQGEQEPSPDAPPLSDALSQGTAESSSSTKKGKKNKKRKDSIQSPTPTPVAIEEPLPVDGPEHTAPASVPSSSELDVHTTEEQPLPSEAMASDPVGPDAILSDPGLSPSEAGTITHFDSTNEGTVEIPETEAVDTTPGSKKAKKKKKSSKASESLLEEPVPDNEAAVSAAADEPTPAVEPISSTAEVKDESEPSSEAQLDTALSKEPVSRTDNSASRHSSDKWQVEVAVEAPLALQSEPAPSEEPVGQVKNQSFTVEQTLTGDRALWRSPRSQPLPPDRLKPAQSSRPSPKRARRRNGAVLPLPTPSRNTRSIPTTCWTTPPSPVWKRASPTRPAARRRIRLSATCHSRDNSKRPSLNTPNQSSLLSSRKSSPPSMHNPKLLIWPPPNPPLPSRS